MTRAALLAVLALPATAGAAPAPTLEQLARQLTRAGKQLRTLSAEFVQRKQMKLFRSQVVTRGRLRYQRPDRLRWETLPPDRSVMLVNGRRAELRVPGQRPRTFDLRRDRTVGLLVEQLLVWFGARPATRLGRTFVVHLSAGQGGRTVARLTPRPGSPLVERLARLEVVLDGQMLVERITIVDAAGDTTTITLRKIIKNAPLAADTFR